MKYVLALAACIGIYVVYVAINITMGWKHGGGAIPYLILVCAWFFTWRAITKKGEKSEDE
jgi:hypothetical protein